MHATIYHNSRCGTSRTTLGLLQDAGIEPEVVDYLAHPPAKAVLKSLIEQSGLTVRDAIRTKEPVHAELGLDDPALSDDALLDAMVANPILINRPFVQTELGTRLCRPAERVLEILPAVSD